MKALPATYSEPLSGQENDPIEDQYLRLLRDLLKAPKRDDRTGVGTQGLFGVQLRHDLADGFPLLTTKRVHFHSVMHELLWMLSGETNVEYLNANKVTIWNEWADDNGDLGPVYGEQWRAFRDPFAGPGRPAHEGVDQIAAVIDSLRSNPMSRRHIVTAWNPLALNSQALPPCHLLFQFYAEKLTADERLALLKERVGQDADALDGAAVPKYRLSCSVYMRSSDAFLGLPFNLAQYALLTHMVAACVDMMPGTLVMTLADVHLYQNHIDQARTQLGRKPIALPRLRVVDPARYKSRIFEIRPEHIDLVEYIYHEAIPAPVAV